MDPQAPSILIPPSYCHYASGQCDQSFDQSALKTVFFAYPSEPEPIASTIEAAVIKLEGRRSPYAWKTWKNMDVPGQTIFCEICRSLRTSSVVVADVTTLSFNVMFEIGYSLSLGLPVIPIRDPTFSADKRVFEEVGLLDTLGYIDFTNSDQLSGRLLEAVPAAKSLPNVPAQEFRQSPIYLLKGPVPTEGTIRLQSTIKKSSIRFRTYDPVETPRLSLHEARRQVAGSAGVIANLLAPQRTKALAHNAQCALISGMALGSGKAVAMVQEGVEVQPIDYRDIVLPWTNPNNLPALLHDVFARVFERLQEGTDRQQKTSQGLLQKLDLGDVAAENEISGLRQYFVSTGQSTQARQGHARLVIGRKGAGKTAIFYNVRTSIGRGHDRMVLDLKPEGHQFVRLREEVLDRLGAGLQEHTMVAFWNYILLGELARSALETDRNIAQVDPARNTPYNELAQIYEKHDPGLESDFSQRLLLQVDRIGRRLGSLKPEEVGPRLTQVVYSGEFRQLTDAVVKYLRLKQSVWLLVDNLDKGWPVRGTSSEDILIVRALLDATRKLQHQLEAQDVHFECLVFLRSDIYEHLRREIPDKGKDTAIRLDWEDASLFQEIVARRIEASTGLRGDFEEMWSHLCEPLVEGHGSFAYILERTLMRPRDLLQFLRAAVQTAINRSHTRVTEEDIIYAEKGYSEDQLLALSFEISDTHPKLRDVLYAFEGAPKTISISDVEDRLRSMNNIDGDELKATIELLMWFGFLGVVSAKGEPRYAYHVKDNIRRLQFQTEVADASLVVHPAFRAALDIGFY
ncbi:P-loop ATPase, Sll1717 family [Actinoplanes utahensis]|uniref:P-loop ATPase, Sll1717 family n=1 Tax=Actinoplanes utahensis TaxID=1869 RepID=UPI000A692EAE|nr:hypothetical protein [Actinoplanes utahensis]GIF29675.1 hypothetical protein Aut01nite_26610 [Actinoplanes utahensis]